MKKPIHLAEAQTQVDEWIKKYGVKYFDPLTNLGILMEETGELARLMVRVYGEQSFKQPTTDEEAKALLKEEWADTFWVLVCLANQMDIDIEEAFQSTMEKKTQRDADRHHANEKLREK